MKYFISVTLFLISMHIHAKTLRIALANTRMPYVNPTTNSGLEFELLKAVLNRMGYELEPVYVPSIKLPSAIQEKDVDGASSLFNLKDRGIFYSDTYVSYVNKVISLKKKNIVITKLEDLNKYSVASFGSAKYYLGESFIKMTDRHKYYTEYKDQSIQPKLLYSGRVDLVVSDIHIFKYHVSRLKEPPKDEVVYADILPVTQYGVAFKDAKIRDSFNLALKALRTEGVYKKIVDENQVEVK